MEENNNLNAGQLFTMSSEAEFLNAHERIQASNKRALVAIESARTLEQQERPIEAIAAYEGALQIVEEVFATPVGLPDNIDAVESEWQDACTIIKRLKAARTEMHFRLKVLRAQHAPVDVAAKEATECDAAAANDGDGSDVPVSKKSLLLENPTTFQDGEVTAKTYKEIISGLRELLATKEDTGVIFDTLFQSTANLYKIITDGVVVKVAGETSMSLVMCTVAGKWQYLNGVCFLQCSPPETALQAYAQTSAEVEPPPIWIYALVPAITICYRTTYGAFILPDHESDTIGTAFGLMLCESPSTTPSSSSGGEPHEPVDADELTDLQQFFLDLLEAVLSAQLQMPTATLAGEAVQQRPARDTSQVVSQHIVSAADFIAHNLVRGAEKTGELMMKGTPYIMSKMQPAAPDAPAVSTTVSTTVEVAKTVTHAAVGVTGWVAGKVGAASMAIGRYLAPHIQTQGAALLQRGLGYDSAQANSTMEGALTIAAGAVEGFTTVYNGLESSAKILGMSLSDNSVKIIEHKYGPSAGTVAADTFDTLGNAFNISQNVNYITPKGLAKKMAKNTGKAVVDDYKRSLRAEEAHFVPAVALYPDLRCLKEQPSEKQ